MSSEADDARAPSALVVAQLEALRRAAAHGAVVDLASGRGRNALALARAAVGVVAVDIDRGSLEQLGAAAVDCPRPPQRLQCDLERRPDGDNLPFRPESCAAILVFRFLFRPLASAIERALAPGGLLLYETFTTRQRESGRGPRRDAFLLRPGELPRLFPHLEVVHYEETPPAVGRGDALARLVARRP